MKFKIPLIVVFIFSLVHANAMQHAEQLDTINNSKITVFDTDSLLESLTHVIKIEKKEQTSVPFAPLLKPQTKIKIQEIYFNPEKQAFDSLKNEKIVQVSDSEVFFKLLDNFPPVNVDTLVLRANPFFIDLVYKQNPLNFNWNLTSDFRQICYGKKASSMSENMFEPIKIITPEHFIADMRQETRSDITRKAVYLYRYTFDQLPDPSIYKNNFLEVKKLTHVKFVENEQIYDTHNRKLFVMKNQIRPWQHKGSGLAQFSQNYVSSNWYQGGNSNVAVLGILSGQINYDDKESIQFDNSAEWRLGFNSVSGDTLRMFSTNDDILKINCKLGIKASGNWFYSSSIEFSTQFFNSYKGINSSIKKASFLTPARLIIGIGMDYKYKKLLSLMISPISYKYIYLNSNSVDPNLFGVKTGENYLSEIGSSFKATFSNALTHEIQIDSKLSFFTNYKKVEIDWEIVCNLVINRFLSTRISIIPRYDNTVILLDGEKANIQFKQLLSVGFSHKFR